MSHDAVVALARTYLADLPAGEPAGRPSAEVAGPVPLAVVEKDTEQAHVVWGVQGLRAGHEDRFALSVMDAVLGGGMSSRLFLEIRERRGLAYAVFSYHSLFRETGSFAVYVGTRPANVEEVVEVVRDQVSLLTSEAVPEAELHKAKESIKGHLVLGLENTRNRMTRLGKNEITDSEILTIDEIVSRIEAVTADDVAALAGRLFGAPASLATIGPLGADDVSRLVS